MKSLKPTNIISIFYISFFWLVYWVYFLLYGIISIFYISFFGLIWLVYWGLLRLLAETRGFWQNGVRETAKTSFAKSSRNAETAKPIKITKLP
jgi:hypothetical protein